MIDTIQMRGNHDGLWSRLTYFFDVRQIHDQSAHRCSRFTTIQNDGLRMMLFDCLFYFWAVDCISGEIQTLFSESLKYISADFTHLFNNFIAVTITDAVGRGCFCAIIREDTMDFLPCQQVRACQRCI